jgi:hypothetical protein
MNKIHWSNRGEGMCNRGEKRRGVSNMKTVSTESPRDHWERGGMGGRCVTHTDQKLKSNEN